MMVRTFFLAFIIFDNRIIDDFNIRVPLTNTRIKNWRTSEVKKKKKKNKKKKKKKKKKNKKKKNKFKLKYFFFYFFFD